MDLCGNKLDTSQVLLKKLDYLSSNYRIFYVLDQVKSTNITVKNDSVGLLSVLVKYSKDFERIKEVIDRMVKNIIRN